jgi:hypothetical protein
MASETLCQLRLLWASPLSFYIEEQENCDAEVVALSSGQIKLTAWFPINKRFWLMQLAGR